MDPESESASQPRVFFTAPWNPVVIRRGDALGLRALADHLADAVAPDLSNRTSDGRWVTILAWCLCRSHSVFHKTGRRHVGTRALERERYAWLRPLELMWVVRTIQLAEEDWSERPLPGQRRVKPWLAYDPAADRFSMRPDQYRAYRQTGSYGGYRLAFRKWPRMTRGGDGWTPDVAALRLAEWLERKLGSARPSFGLQAGISEEDDIPNSHWNTWQGTEERWWLKNWPEFASGGKTAEINTLPRRFDDFSVLPEANLLKPIAFGSDPSGKRRTEVAKLVCQAKAVDHQGVVDYLADSLPQDEAVQVIPLFARLADAGMRIMGLIWSRLGKTETLRLSDLKDLPEARKNCAALIEAARAWQARPGFSIRHIEMGDRFAAAVSGNSVRQCLKSVIDHHERSGGGMRWFVLRDDVIVPRAAPGAESSNYRFRLWSLCRLATQCGVIPYVPRAIVTDGLEDREADDSATGSYDD